MAMTWEDARAALATAQPSHYSKPKAAAARDGAIAAVGAGADPAWIAAALTAVRETAASFEYFTTDTILQAYPELEVCEEPRAWGWVMRTSGASGVCVATPEWWKSKRIQSHGRPKQVWRSLIGGTQDPRLIPDA